MESWHSKSTDNLVQAFLCLRTEDECYAFLEDICTIKEVLDIAQRLDVASMLDKKTVYNEISRKTGASSATISRVSKCYEYGSGGYGIVLNRLKDVPDSEKNNDSK